MAKKDGIVADKKVCHQTLDAAIEFLKDKANIPSILVTVSDEVEGTDTYLLESIKNPSPFETGIQSIFAFAKRDGFPGEVKITMQLGDATAVYTFAPKKG